MAHRHRIVGKAVRGSARAACRVTRGAGFVAFWSVLVPSMLVYRMFAQPVAPHGQEIH